MKKDRKKQTQLSVVWGRLKRNPVAMASLALVVIIILLAAFSEVITPYDYTKQDLTNRFAMPSWEHLFGTDNLGRDLFARVLVGGKISLLVGLMAIAFASIVGCFLGATAGYYGGTYELVVMKLMDILMAIPQFLLAVSVSAALGSGVFNTALAVGIASIPRFVRMMRAEVLTVKGKEFVESARSSGARDGRIIWKHIVPNALSSTIINITLCIPGAILAISSLSFIGLGVQPPTPEWGSILSAGRQYIRDFWPMVVFPGVAIMLTVIGFNLFGDGLRDAMDPKLKR